MFDIEMNPLSRHDRNDLPEKGNTYVYISQYSAF